MKGKGNITLDDIAKGIEYNKEPYSTAKNFSVMAPDVTSQQKFYDVNNYTHKYLEKEPRSLLIEYKSKKPAVPIKIVNLETQKNKSQILEPHPPIQNNLNMSVNNPNPQTPVAALNKTVISRANNISKTLSMSKSAWLLPRKASVYHPKELYSPKANELDLPFYKTNPFSGTKYHNMLATLCLNKTDTLGDVLRKSRESLKTVKLHLKQQTDKKYLTLHNLPKLPPPRSEPKVVRIGTLKNVTLVIGNDVHNKMTNVGFTRTSYGGYYMH